MQHPETALRAGKLKSMNTSQTASWVFMLCSKRGCVLERVSTLVHVVTGAVVCSSEHWTAG
jgi:hypothetical protein